MSRIDALRVELGGAHPIAAKKVKDHLEPYVRAFIEQSPFAVMSSSNANGDCDASPKGGEPGFVKVIDDRTLLIPDIGGNRLFQSYQNFESNPKAGFPVPDSGNGRHGARQRPCAGLDGDELKTQGDRSTGAQSGRQRRPDSGLVLDIDEAYFHCPRSFQFAELWDTDTIATNRARSLKDLKKD